MSSANRSPPCNCSANVGKPCPPKLETWLGARVLHRTTRRVSLTPAGEVALARCRAILELGEDMRAALANPNDAPHGQIRITCSTSFGLSHMAAAVADYVARYTGTAVDNLLVDRAVNLSACRISPCSITSS